MEYNLLKEPWLDAIYMDGSKKEIGIIEAFKDAEKIKDIETPTFHKSKFLLHEMNATLLLSAIIMSAYNRYFEEGGGATDEEYIQHADSNGLWNKITEQYLTEFEDRFDMFDEKHPFLQNAALKNEQPNDSFDTILNPVAPNKSNPVFGMVRAHKKNSPDNYRAEYQISFKEFAYLLIHSATTSQITNKYMKAVSAKVCSFVMLKGQNLKETVLNNCTLTNSEDKPIWEMESIEEYKNLKRLNNDVLACLYFPCANLYAAPDNDTKTIKSVVLRNEDDTKSKDILRYNLGETIKEIALTMHPYALRAEVPKKDCEDETEINYYHYRKEDEAWVLCMAAAKDVKHANKPMEICQRLDKKFTINFYCREYDKHKVTILNCKKLEIKNQPWLQTEEGQALAEDFKSFYGKAIYTVKEAIKAAKNPEGSSGNGKDQSELNRVLSIVSPKVEQYFTQRLYDNTTNNECMKINARKFIKNVFMEAYEEVLQHTTSPCGFIKGYSCISRLRIEDKNKEKEQKHE